MNDRGFALSRFGATHGRQVREMYDAGEDVTWLDGYDPDKIPYPFDWEKFYSGNVRGRVWPGPRIISFWTDNDMIEWDGDGVLTKGADLLMRALRKMPKAQGWPSDVFDWNLDVWTGTNGPGDKLVRVKDALGRGRGGGYETARQRFLSRMGD